MRIVKGCYLIIYFFKNIVCIINITVNIKVEESIVKRVSYLDYQIAKAIYKNVILVSASDNEALIFIYK